VTKLRKFSFRKEAQIDSPNGITESTIGLAIVERLDYICELLEEINERPQV